MAITYDSVEDYEEMVRLGVLTENGRVVLIRGEIVPKMPIGPRHPAPVKRHIRLLIARAGETVIIGSQDPVRLHDSELRPESSLGRLHAEPYASEHPRPADVFLVIEVARILKRGQSTDIAAPPSLVVAVDEVH
jgi:hypothetical protein